MARLIARGTIGILYPAGVVGPVHKCHRLYFSEQFLLIAPTMWTVITVDSRIHVHYNNSPFHATWLLTGYNFHHRTATNDCYVCEGRRLYYKDETPDDELERHIPRTVERDGRRNPATLADRDATEKQCR